MNLDGERSLYYFSAFGERTPTYDTPHSLALYEMMEKWSKVMEHGATPPVDIWPWLRHVPERFFNNWISKSREVGRCKDVLYDGILTKVLQRRKNGVIRDSLIDRALDQEDKLALDRDNLKFLGGVTIEGGSESTASVLLAVMQAMIKWPEVQKKAQREIDSEIDESRSPVWSDYSKLPYIEQVIKEVMRWRPIGPLAFPHCLAKGIYLNPRIPLRRRS
jgi:cytochrome P450